MWSGPAHAYQIMGNDTEANVSFKSPFALVIRPHHPEAMFERGNAGLDPRPPCLPAPEPSLFLTRRP